MNGCFNRNYNKEKPHVRNFPPAILGPDMAAPISWAPGFVGSFCRRKTSMPTKFLVLGRGGSWVFFHAKTGGGGDPQKCTVSL